MTESFEDIRLPHDHGPQIRETLKSMPPDGNFKTLAQIFKLLGDPSRIKIFWLLCHCKECVLNISAIVGMSSPAVSHHLKMLKDSGLIESERDGKEVYYEATRTAKAEMLHHTIEQVMEIAYPATIRGDG